jgi:chromosomal replication initiation ATPase DnaA
MEATFNIYKAAVQYQQPKEHYDITIIRIKDVITEVTGIVWEQINLHTRTRDIVFARQLFHYLVRTFTDLTLKKIGKLTFHNYGHFTILHSKSEIENIIDLKHRSINFKVVESAILRMQTYTGKIII